MVNVLPSRIYNVVVYIVEENYLFIGKLAKQTGISTKTIRYYEEINLLPKPKRAPNNYRIYSEDIFKRLNFIRKAKDLGFTLGEIKEVLTISDSGLDPCERIGKMLKTKIFALEKKLKELRSLQNKLKKLDREWSKIQIQEECDKGNLICSKIEKYISG